MRPTPRLAASLLLLTSLGVTSGATVATRGDIRVVTSPVPDLAAGTASAEYQGGESVWQAKLSGCRDLGGGWVAAASAFRSGGVDAARDFGATGVSLAGGRVIDLAHGLPLTLAATVGALRGSGTSGGAKADVSTNQAAVSALVVFQASETIGAEFSLAYVWNQVGSGSYNLSNGGVTGEQMTVGGTCTSFGVRWKASPHVDLRADYTVYEKGGAFNSGAWTVGAAYRF